MSTSGLRRPQFAPELRKRYAENARWQTLLVVPLASAVALVLHWLGSKNEPSGRTMLYTYFLSGLLLVAIGAILLQPFWSGLRSWMRARCPLVAAAVLFLAGWELVTSVLRWLPLPYFPSPAGVLQSLLSDRVILFDSTWHSLLLLLGGYALGVAAGLVSGICIGWFPHARYWGMPVLKIIGPIPATAWIPLAMVLWPSAIFSAIALIALAVWFPVTMLTASGKSIFIGLFMGLGASFLTLVVAETVGVKSGLGWYLSWAQGWAEYWKVYAALLIMAAFFSTIVTALFKIRDRILAWQKGVIKW